jgi:hypothetical protein
LNTKLPQFYIKGSTFGLPLSSFQIAEDYILIVSKTGRYVDVYWEDIPKTTSLTDASFDEQELKELEYFYPRDVVLDPFNPNIFYIKLPTRVARFAIL